ncbi:hypothetical protein HU200_046967 [Digitaria exilis]|uniref:Uncharacterized protein n=1 Tax=Digitaria exilis TaxID=1010633 RepID=A0A835B064_9POAL|nr:hypothetical protein HU200_046967 [Digitaria exilis]
MSNYTGAVRGSEPRLSVSLLAATTNQDGHQREETKTTEMNTGDDLDGSPHPTQETIDGPPSFKFIYYEDDFRYCYDDDSHLQEDDDCAADEPQDDNELPEEEEHAPAPPPTSSSLAAKLAEYARQKIAGVNTAGAVITGLGVVGGAVGAYFLLPAVAGVAVAAGATMKAPGAAGFLISRAAFVANPQLYFQILRTAGAAAAAAAFALHGIASFALASFVLAGIATTSIESIKVEEEGQTTRRDKKALL